jgi:hypothetical protein
MAEETRSTEPHDRLTRICDAMTKTMDLHPERLKGDRAIVFLDSTDEKRGGINIHGYDDDIEAIVDLFMHMRAIMRANGKDLDFIAIPDDARGLTNE